MLSFFVLQEIVNKKELNFTRFGYDHRYYDTIINRYRWEESLGFYSFMAEENNQRYKGLVEMSGNYPASLPSSESLNDYIKLSEPFNNMSKEEYVKYEAALLTKEFNANFIKKSLESESTVLTPTAREYFENLLNELESSRKQ